MIISLKRIEKPYVETYDMSMHLFVLSLAKRGNIVALNSKLNRWPHGDARHTRSSFASDPVHSHGQKRLGKQTKMKNRKPKTGRKTIKFLYIGTHQGLLLSVAINLEAWNTFSPPFVVDCTFEREWERTILNANDEEIFTPWKLGVSLSDVSNASPSSKCRNRRQYLIRYAQFSGCMFRFSHHSHVLYLHRRSFTSLTASFAMKNETHSKNSKTDWP